MINDICGTLDQHASWSFFETPVFSANIARFIVHGEQKSFLLNGNTYVLATGETLSADKALVNDQYSWYFNDQGDRFHIAGLYYRKQFSGITTEGKQLIDYLVRKIQVFYRSEHGQRTLKEKSCPYTEHMDEINDCIQQCLGIHRDFAGAAYREENLHGVTSFSFLKQEEIKIPTKFKYVRETSLLPKVVLSGHNDDTSIDFLEIPDEVEEIGPLAFAGCTNLRAIIGGFGLKKIGAGAFLDCTNLRTVVLQDGIECIEDGAFGGCINLEEVLIPTSVHKIGDNGGDCVFGGAPTILCEKYTAAYHYAVEHNLRYKVSEMDS